MNPAHSDIVCKLNRSLYSLKHAPRAWYSRFATVLPSQGFVEDKAYTSVFVFHNGLDTALYHFTWGLEVIFLYNIY
jgi:hypothetical protein